MSASPTWGTRPTTGCGARSTYTWVNRHLFWQLSREGNLHGSGISHATTVFPKSSFRAPWWFDGAMFGRGNAGWAVSKNGHPCPFQNGSQGPPAEEKKKKKKTGRGSLLNRPSCPPDDPIGQGTGLNCCNAVGFFIERNPERRRTIASKR